MKFCEVFENLSIFSYLENCDRLITAIVPLIFVQFWKKKKGDLT